MVETPRAPGGLHTLEDFSSFQPEYVYRICVSYRGFELWECPPNRQGVVPLVMAKALEGFDVASWAPDSVACYHAMTEIGRQAYADRDCFIGDLRTGPVPIKELLSEERAAKLRARVAFDRRLLDLAPFPIPEHRDTAFLAVVDRDRNAVALINSIFDDFGSGIVTSGSGIILHNSAASFVLTRDHANVIAGHDRPLNTIIPAVLTRGGKAVMPFGVTGGHFQPFGPIQILTNVVDHGMVIQEAIDQPRIFARGESLQVEGTVSTAAADGLRKLGHNVTRAENSLGAAQAIWIDWDQGLLQGGADGRRDGIALGW
jgi:gamma-glutamyltranspeptidase/glutathione hydrolase